MRHCKGGARAGDTKSPSGRGGNKEARRLGSPFGDPVDEAGPLAHLRALDLPADHEEEDGGACGGGRHRASRSGRRRPVAKGASSTSLATADGEPLETISALARKGSIFSLGDLRPFTSLCTRESLSDNLT